ncbi:IS1380 family transposase, partial [Nocardia zapadnayensis]|nr:IS1380 family transposase [Nocardia zapadnayensis]
HNLLRAAGTLASPVLGKARGSTLRRKIIAVPARFARPQRKPVLHLPAHWPWTAAWRRLWQATISTS